MKIILEVIKGPHINRKYVFDEHDVFLVGRGTGCHFRLPKHDRYFSRRHFMIELNPPLCQIMDMGSTNGTIVNGKPLADRDNRCLLNDGDIVKGGDTKFRVTIERQDAGQLLEAEPVNRQSNLSDVDELIGWEQLPIEPFDSPSEISSASEVESEDSEGSFDVLEPIEETPEAQPARDLLPSNYKELIAAIDQPFPGYAIVDELGRGGMGVVFRAIRDCDQCVVALKAVTPAVSADEVELERFVREAQILEDLKHPNIVRFLQMGEVNGVLFFAMELVHGVDAGKLLRRRLAKGKQGLTIKRAVRITCDLLQALEYAHSKGFVHRDIKPANVLLQRSSGNEDIVKLADFGLARAYQASRISGLTMIGDVAGTIPFMSPEQILAYRDVQPAGDQYSVGATLYNLLTGSLTHEFPFDQAVQMNMILDHQPIPIQTQRNDIPDALAFAVHRSLAKDPANRFSSVEEFRQALSPYLD